MADSRTVRVNANEMFNRHQIDLNITREEAKKLLQKIIPGSFASKAYRKFGYCFVKSALLKFIVDPHDQPTLKAFINATKNIQLIPFWRESPADEKSDAAETEEKLTILLNDKPLTEQLNLIKTTEEKIAIAILMGLDMVQARQYLIPHLPLDKKIDEVGDFNLTQYEKIFLMNAFKTDTVQKNFQFFYEYGAKRLHRFEILNSIVREFLALASFPEITLEGFYELFLWRIPKNIPNEALQKLEGTSFFEERLIKTYETMHFPTMDEFIEFLFKTALESFKPKPESEYKVEQPLNFLSSPKTRGKLFKYLNCDGKLKLGYFKDKKFLFFGTQAGSRDRLAERRFARDQKAISHALQMDEMFNFGDKIKFL